MYVYIHVCMYEMYVCIFMNVMYVMCQCQWVCGVMILAMHS